MSKEKLKFINQQIATYEELYEDKLLRLDTVMGTSHEKRHRFDMNFYKERANLFREIKEELEVMELIKNGWSSMETTLVGDQIMRFQNLKIDDWVKLWNKLEKILLKKALEVKDND